MLERFKQIKSKTGDKISRFLNDSLGIPHPLNEVLAGFSHKPDCGGVNPLKIITEENGQYVSGLDPRISGLFVTETQKFVQCEECGAREQFME